MKLLLYCTKAKNKYDRLVRDEHYGKPFYLYGAITENFESLNGKIVAECDFEVEEIIANDVKIYDEYGIKYTTKNGYQDIDNNFEALLNNSCLNSFELNDYLGGYGGYAIHIKNLHIFDETKKLSEYGMDFPISPIVKAPQNMMYANGIGERYILISIKPEWLCKILNGEKTIEVRKKVLKEMLNNE